jgi:uncharacterized phage protein gp47/JayE
MLPIPSYDSILAQVLAFFRNRFPGKDTHTESFLGKAARAIARSISYFLVSLQSVDQDAVPSTKTSLQALTNMAFAYGLPSNQGGYGANGAVAASGGAALFSGTRGQPIPDGTSLLAPDGVTQLKTSGLQTIPGTPPGADVVTCSVIAVTAGVAGNLSAGTTLTLPSPPSGINGTATMTSPTTNGLNSESQLALLARVLGRWQNPPKGGASPDYRTWAESRTGVARAYVYPKRQGTGTVDVVVVAGGTGAARKPSAAVQTDVNNYINGNATSNPPVQGQRPVTSSGTNVLLPNVSLTGLAIRVRVIVSAPKYAFDWSLGASSLTVSTWSSPTLTTVESLPASLTAAVDAYLATPTTVSPPRLQVVATGLPSSSPVAVPVYVIAYNAGAKTLTLQTPLPSSWTAPVAGNPIYPYGSAVPIAAQGARASSTPVVIGGIQGYVDSLGPSKASGYANPLDSWDDTASYIACGRAALDELDVDGAKPVSRVIAATINGSAADVQAADTLANGVQLLTCASIAITD